MTYQEIVNRIQSVTDNHKMLADFGYGDISDLKVRFENTSDDSAVGADYPYLFLNPGVHQRNQSLVTYNFNMIVMDLARGEVSDQPYNNMLAIQSQCQQYIDDVLANLYYGFEDNPEVIFSGVSYTPFNERFQDDVAGVTANLTIQVPQPLDNCISPFPGTPETLYWYDALNCDGSNLLYHSQYSIDRLPVGTVFKNNSGVCYTITEWRDTGNTTDVIVETGFIDCNDCNGIVPPVGTLVLDVNSTSDQQFRPEIEQSPMTFQTVNLDTLGGWSSNNFQLGDKPAGTWSFTMQGTLRRLSNNNEFPTSLNLVDGISLRYIEPDVSDWPVDPALGADIPFTLQWNSHYFEPSDNLFAFQGLNEPPNEDEFLVLSGATLIGTFDGVIPPPPPAETTVLEFTQNNLQEVNNTNAAYNFADYITNDTYFSRTSYSNFSYNEFTSSNVNIQFDGTFQYQPINGFDPANYQMAVYNSSSNIFLGMIDMPATDGVVSMKSNTFEFPAGFGNYYLTFYEKGTPNPQANPPGVLKPLKFTGTFKINLVE